MLWLYGILFVFFYLGIMLWQTYYAIATCRTAAWGTRPATAGLGGGAGRGAPVSQQLLDQARARACCCCRSRSFPVLLLGPSLVRAPATLWRRMPRPGPCTPRLRPP